MSTVVIADTGPILYLHLIGRIELLPTLFGEISLPSEVHSELCAEGAPQALRTWASAPPGWFHILSAPSTSDQSTASLHKGERAAIALALELRAELLLIDERKGYRIARAKGFMVTGTIGVLDLAARKGLVDIQEAVVKLRATNFRCKPEMLEALAAGGRSRPSQKE